MKITRREFIKKGTLGTVGVAAASAIPVFSAKSYGRIIGANDRVILAVSGVHSRGAHLARTMADKKNVEVKYLCDVDSDALAAAIGKMPSSVSAPKGIKDFRTILSDKDLDGVVIAMPDHWHAPAAIMCAQAGKNVYVEKPVSHNPREGELLVEAMNKYKVVVEMGSQRRSSPLLQEAMSLLHNGEIGKITMVKGWYSNGRGPLTLKKAPVPSNLDWDLWQGPAPRREYMDGLVHYNWHWLWHWGTGEALNNGTHEIDVIRWGLGVDFPTKVTSVGGRYHFQDAWETPDTQYITWEAPGGVSVLWEGRSCNRMKVEGMDRGVMFYGEKGSMLTGGNSYTIFANAKKCDIVKQKKTSDMPVDGQNTVSPDASMDVQHTQNFVDSIRGIDKPTSTALTGHISTTWVQLGNISQRVGRNLSIDPKNGHIIGDKEAAKLWGRTYEKGWEVRV